MTAGTTAMRVAGSVLAPADWVRRRWLRALGPLARPLMVNRDFRVAAIAGLFVCTATIATLTIPLWLLALGPVVWGIPHLLADLRYLVISPGYHRRPLVLLFAGVPVFATAFGADVLTGFLGAAGAVLVSRVPVGRKLVGLSVVGLLAWALSRTGGAADVVFAHAHNFLAVALWWAWRPRAGRLHWIPIVLYVLACALLMSDFAFEVLAVTHGLDLSLGRLDAGYQVLRLSPGIAPKLGMSLVLMFAFAQTMHYAVWLKLLPDDDRERHTPPPFARSFRTLVDDIGGPLVVLGVVFVVGLALWSVFDLMSATHGYFRMARFHGHLELAAIALLWMEGRSR